ncbi:uncharacterized protein LOC127788251 isoform X2 [Diospyros lotus]|uniref:uncharacterized protein LOC127788251 isoform X2 n=1 Tax=Diospyros lotus TaxID=55363 RepID=UPI002251441D|nr:uncharacterized protein LOC127788251 isoform X2 [Diospyros lotus]
MLKRQQTARSSSSSSRRENVAEHRHAAAVGCMAGLLHLSSKYKPRRRFLITFGRKPGKKVEDEEEVASPACKSEMGLVQGDCEEEKGGDKARHVRRLSCQVPRSPTLPAEIRRSNSVNSRTPEESFRLTTAAQTQPALVARLMGLEEIPSADQSAAEKRRKLLMSALEKCDEDLKAIKQIIDALRSGDSPRSTPVAKRKRIAKNEDAVSGEQPTPISVLRSFTRTPSAAASKVHIIKDGQMATAGMMMIKDGCAIDYDYLKCRTKGAAAETAGAEEELPESRGGCRRLLLPQGRRR